MVDDYNEFHNEMSKIYDKTDETDEDLQENI